MEYITLGALLIALALFWKASGVYNYFKAHVMDAEYDLTGTVTCALMNVSHGFTAEHDTWSDVSANEISGTGYSSPGLNLTTPAVTIDDTDDEGVFDAVDAEWTTATFSAYHAVIYDNAHASDALVCSIDFGGEQQVTAGTFTIQWATEGIVNIS